jgi:hypothetical protein
MVGMKKSRLPLLLLLLSACEPPAPPPPGLPPREPVGAAPLLVGLPGGSARAVVDVDGLWGVGKADVAHSVQVGSRTYSPEGAKTGLFRSTLPFPQTTWTAGPFEITQLVFPAGSGFVARYQVMNHGEEAKTCTLNVTGALGATFTLELSPGTSAFVSAATPDLGRAPEGALEAAVAVWEKALGGRGIEVPDPATMTRYHAALAAKILGSPEDPCVAATEGLLFKVSGESIVLVPALPEGWRKEQVIAKALPTPFGPLSFSYSGAYDNRAVELDGACKPPGGFVLAAGGRTKAKVDGADAAIKDGELRVPAGVKTLELFNPLQ